MTEAPPLGDLIKKRLQEEVDAKFAQIMRRPASYAYLSESDQWEIDKDLGILDLDLRWSDLSERQKAEYYRKFK